MRDKISACITCMNEEQNIRRCLESVKWCDEIVVVDSFSTDRTVEICKEYTTRVYEHEWLGYIGQKNLIRGMATHPWVLFLDADEEVSPGLRDEILAELGRQPNPYAGYRFPRKVFYLYKWICHGEWYPDIKLRFFRKDKGHSEGREPHDLVVVDGAVKMLRNPLYHYTYSDIREHLATIGRFSVITAEEKFKEGIRFRYADWLVRPPWRFFKAYIFKLGFLDGRRGFFIAALSAFAVLIKYALLWEKELDQKHQGTNSKQPDGTGR